MLSIRLKPGIEKRLSRLAKVTGRTKTFYASKLIEENLRILKTATWRKLVWKNAGRLTPARKFGGPGRLNMTKGASPILETRPPDTARYWIIWTSALENPGIRAVFGKPYGTADSVFGATECATMGSFAVRDAQLRVLVVAVGHRSTI